MKKSCLLLALCLWPLIGQSAPTKPTEITQGYEADALQANELLEKAIARYQEIGDAALAEFSRQGPFTTNSQYVYVVSTQGVMLASGGPSAIFIGREISPLLDDYLKKAFAQALAEPENGIAHSQEYRWMNWKDSKVERKHVFYQRLGDKVFATGYYLPRSSPAEAQKLLDDAVAALAKDSATSLSKINQLDPYFNRDDLYVFVVDNRTQHFVAHGFDRRLIGTDFRHLKNIDNQPIGQQMLTAIKGKEKAQVDYLWHNPMTGEKEFKHTLIEHRGDYLIAVGYYNTVP